MAQVFGRSSDLQALSFFLLIAASQLLEPALSGDFRSYLPLRGGSGFTSDSLISSARILNWNSVPHRKWQQYSR